VSDVIATEVAAAIGAAAVLDGGGGDNVFCSLQSAAPVADCLLAYRGRRHLIRTATSIASIAQVSAIEVLRRAAVRALRPRRRYRWPADRDLLSDAAMPLAVVPDHPWLYAPDGILPGKAAHVALLAAAQSYVEGFDPELDPPLASPLLAQPLVELCLSVPSWLWFEHGQSRAVARRAFRGALPQHILARRTKGTPDSFVAQLYERHRTTIRARLLDGWLAGNGLLDRAAIAVLTDGRPLSDQPLHRIMTLFDAEVWAEGWSA
jgi:asparagine synthase (glutamine-hydrolysing)